MTKRRRKKINRLMSDSAYKYVEKEKFAYLLKQAKLYNKHKSYLLKMGNRTFQRFTQKLLAKYKEKVNG